MLKDTHGLIRWDSETGGLPTAPVSYFPSSWRKMSGIFINMQVCYPSQRTEQGSHKPTPPTPASFSHDDSSVSRQGCWNPGEETGNHQIRWTSILHRSWGFPCGSDGKESAGNAGDPASTPGSVRSPGEGDGYSLQCSCLENSTDRGAWQAAIHGIAKSQTRLSH